MDKTGKTEAELVSLLNDELSQHDVCDGVRATDVYRLPNADGDHDANWDAGFLRASGTPILPDCRRVFIAAKYKLQQKFFLLTDD